MSNILRIDLDQNHQICMILEFNVFQEKNFEIRKWIEEKTTKKHVELDDLIDTTDPINHRLRLGYATKSLKGIIKLMKINNLIN